MTRSFARAFAAVVPLHHGVRPMVTSPDRISATPGHRPDLAPTTPFDRRRPLLRPAPLAALLVATLLCAACRDGVTEPLTTPPDVLIANAVELQQVLIDAQTRLLPNLPTGIPRSDLATALSALARALSNGQSIPIRQALMSANAAADRVALVVTDDADGNAELSAIRLELDAIDVQLVAAQSSSVRISAVPEFGVPALRVFALRVRASSARALMASGMLALPASGGVS